MGRCVSALGINLERLLNSTWILLDAERGIFRPISKSSGFEVLKEALDLPACGIITEHFFWIEVSIMLDHNDQLLLKVPIGAHHITSSINQTGSG